MRSCWRRRRDTDETDVRASTVSEVFWQEYQSRDRVKEREESERVERRKERKGERKGERSERKKDTVDGAWTLRLRDHRLTFSFIIRSFLKRALYSCMMYVSFSTLARRARRVIIFARPQIVNEDINLVRALTSTREFIALDVVLFHN